MRTRHRCPKCNKAKTYTRYIDTVTGNHLPYQYGKCERINNCGYHLNPYKDGYSKQIWKDENLTKPYIHQEQEQPKRESFFIPLELFKASLRHYHSNMFASYLIKLFGANKAKELIQRFYLGTSKQWKGATVFWVIDEQMNIAGGQVVLFDEEGHTYKEKKSDGSIYRYTRWVHSALKHKYRTQNKSIPKWLEDYCLYANKFPVPFGLPQLYKETTPKPIAMVEAPKTAVIASGYLPQYNWVAIGGASYLNNIHRVEPLEGKEIVLFPDAGCYDMWSSKAKEFSHLAKFTVSDLLERKGAKQGEDIADYLVKMNYKDFINVLSNKKQPKEKPRNKELPYDWKIESNILINQFGYPANWDKENESLVKTFSTVLSEV